MRGSFRLKKPKPPKIEDKRKPGESALLQNGELNPGDAPPVKKTRARRPKSTLEEAGLPAKKSGIEQLYDWFSGKGWTPWEFQKKTWQAYQNGQSGLVHIPTGAGKTYSAYIGPLAELIDNPGEGIRILYITPLRALTRDIELALRAPIEDLKLPITIESRTGDTSSATRARQRKKLPNILITTPESLTLLLTHENAKEKLGTVSAVILDEWHELLTSKRGIQIELAMARLRRWSPNLRTWALSATIANLEEAAKAALGIHGQPVLVSGKVDRPIVIDTLIPENIETFPWGGHLGGRMLKQVVEEIDVSHSTLIFTNVRSHAEKWFHDLLDARPDWAGMIALHHGSLDRREREFVEAGLKDGTVRIVVCTSSLDLGVDFAPVERVFQIGSPKGIARIIQRAGRAAHRPGAACHITCVPTHAFELLEIAAVRKAIGKGEVESRIPLKKPYDVLAQHIVTCAMGGSFIAHDLYDEVIQTMAYQHLTREEFDWLLKLVREGGNTLRAYPEYHKVEEWDGKYIVPNPRIAHLHRFNIGTILSEASLTVAYLKGKTLGTVEEYFISRLNPGDVFIFAGKTLEFVGVRENVAYVRDGKGKTSNIPRWDGGRLPFSASLAESVRETLERGLTDKKPPPEMKALRPILETQKFLSKIPKADELLAEIFRSPEGYHMYLYPFEGRMVHEGLAAVLALRLTRFSKATFQLSVNDYGLEFVCETDFPYEEALKSPGLFSQENLVADILESMNMSELAKRQFREIARVANLVYQNYPGSAKTARQLQSSSSLLYEVFRKFDPDNLFLQQSRQEVLEKQFEESRLSMTLKRLQQSKVTVQQVGQPTPLAFPLMVERIGAHFSLSSESLAERVKRMQEQWIA